MLEFYVLFHFSSFRFNLHKSWSSTVWILNLAFADMFYCFLYLSVYAIFFLRKSWTWGLTACKLFALFHNSAELTAWMSVAIVAASRCMILYKFKVPTTQSMTKNQILIIISARVYGFLCHVPTILGVIFNFFIYR